jgi:multiple sugar transport system permease protein
VQTLTLTAVLLAVSAVYLAPFAWMLATSFKAGDETSAGAPALPLAYAGKNPNIAREAGVDPAAPGAVQRLQIVKHNYVDKVIADPAIDISLYARNTLIIAGLSTLGTVLSSSLVAYALAKLRWRGRGAVFAVVLGTMMVPGMALMIPTYLVWNRLGLVGTNVPLWLGSFFGSAFNIFLLRQFYMTIPNELSDAARIDGCSEFAIWWRVVLPLSRPALAVVALFAFMGAWKDYMGPLIYLLHQRQYTLSLFLANFQSTSGTPWELVMAASVLVILPVIVLFFLAQKTFIQGIATTGLKG